MYSFRSVSDLSSCSIYKIRYICLFSGKIGGFTYFLYHLPNEGKQYRQKEKPPLATIITTLPKVGKQKMNEYETNELLMNCENGYTLGAIPKSELQLFGIDFLVVREFLEKDVHLETRHGETPTDVQVGNFLVD